jgi:hypothetical protein
MHPGAEAWVWGWQSPRKVFLTTSEPDGCWNFTFSITRNMGSAHESYLSPDELSAQRAWLKFELQDFAILQARIAKTKARIAELEASGE